jgi:hypothetical protein
LNDYIYITAFAIDIDAPDDFDVDLFDSQANEIASNSEHQDTLKFVIVGSAMVLFSYDTVHVDAYMDIALPKYGGELVCAGMVRIGDDTRSIWGNSESLEHYRKFKTETSDEFKNTRLKQALGEYFQIR